MDSTKTTIKKLSEMNEDELNRLYLRVFNSDDGVLILQDLKNRAFYFAPTINYLGGNDPIAIGCREGMRAMVLHIETMMKRPETRPEGMENGISTDGN